MTDDEKEFVKKVNIEKAMNKTLPCIFFSIASLLSYIVPFVLGDFDFGMVFEILTLILIIIARNYMSKYDEERSKRFTILAMIPIGWLFIYDLIALFSYISDVLDFTFVGSLFISQEFFNILVLIALFAINKDLGKADNPEKYKENTDWFYERMDEKDDIRKNKNI